MTRKAMSRIVFWALLISLSAALTSADRPAFADGPIKKVVKKERASRGHLPKYYANVVTEEQREKILKIQEEYKPKIEALQAQLKVLKKEQDDKISAVLSEEQKKKVEEAKAKEKEAKKGDGKEKADAKDSTKPVEAAPLSPPAKPAQ
jgi:Spy/CpxP family protein refolding chaperone